METKPALYTTEFWIHNLIQVLLFLNTSHIWNYVPGTWGHIGTMAAQAFLAALYAISRGIAKSKGSFDPHLASNYKLFPRMKHTTARSPRTH